MGATLPILRGSRDAADLGSKLEGPGPCGSMLGRDNVTMDEVEATVDRAMNREEALRLPGRLELPRLLFFRRVD